MAMLTRAAPEGRDRAAIGELYRRIGSRARAVAACHCPPSDVDDAVADGFVRALNFLEQLRDPFAAESWVIRCVATAAVDLRRRRWRQRPNAAVVELFERTTPPSEPADQLVLWALDREDVVTALRALPQQIRTILRLRYEATLSVRQIADLLDQPEGTVRRHCYEARRLARDHYLRVTMWS